MAVLLALLPLASVQASGAGLSGHKVRVSDPALGPQIVAQGGRLLEDYGSFQLFSVARLPPGLAANPHVEVHDEYNLVLLNAGSLDTRNPAVKQLRLAVGNFAGRRLHVVQFAGPVRPEWARALKDTGAQLIDYIPHHAYVVYGDAPALARVQALAATTPQIQWEAPFADSYKIHPRARLTDHKGRPRDIGTDVFAIQLVADPEANRATLQLLDQLKREPFRRQQRVLNYLNVIVRLAAQDLARVAAQPEVISIQPYFEPRKFCERQDQIVSGKLSGDVPIGPGYLAWLTGKGFTQAQFDASGFAVDVSDSGLDNGTTTPGHPGLYTAGELTNTSRVVYARLEGTPNFGSTLAGCDGHGTLNSHIIGGYNDLTGFPFTDASGFHYGLGVCPFVALGSSVVFDPDNFTNPNYNDLQSEAYQSGARISNNSWGSDVQGVYDLDAQNYDVLVRDAQPGGSTYPADGNQEMVMVFAAGNSGSGAITVGSPGTAKNVITVGAAENVQAFGGSDGSGISDAEADSANDIVYFSSRGPCADGRHKPDLVAPGTHVSGGVIQAFDFGPDGTADACFNGSGVSGGVGSLFYPPGQEFYTASSGTSHSTPCVSGGCALLRQYFINNFSNSPSPAMTKAYLLNSARYLTGLWANDTLWSDSQGFGEMDLGMALDGVPRLLRDENPADLFTAAGQSRTFTGYIADTNQAFRVTLAWTDARGSTAGAAYNNDLDLTVSVGGNSYKGNVFSGPYSVTGGTADAVDNVESVFLPPGISGSFAVTITAADINSDAISNNASAPEQDFALVVYNGIANRASVLLAQGYSLLAENCSPTNGAVDPGETVTLLFALQNFGTGDTTNLVATLLPGAGVVSPSAPQTYGVLVAGGLAVSRPFTFTASGACGTTVAARLQLQDGPANLDPISFNLPLGQLIAVTNLTENFDEVVAPSLPTGWTTTMSGAASNWVAAPGPSDTAPNSLYAAEPEDPGIADLVSSAIHINSAAAQVSFQNFYNTEADPSGTVGYDGGVLEIKIGEGPFTDILAAGGSFVSGGYTMTLDPLGDNPLAGRQAWSGNNGWFVPAIINLPAAAAGQEIQLKWRLATDSGNYYGGSGWYIDTVVVEDLTYACCGSISPRISAVSANGGKVTITLNSLAGHQYQLEYKNSLSDSQWLPLSASQPGTGDVISLIDTSPPAVSRFYRVRCK